MVQAASLFNQLLQHFPRTEFAALVKKHGAEHAAKGFTCWTQFVSMLFCQLGRADSLREICNGLACCLGRLVHLVIAKPAVRPCPMPTNTVPPPCSRSCSGPPRPASANSRRLVAGSTVPFQKQTSVAGLHHHLTVPDPVSVGQVPARQGWGEGPRATGPRRLPAGLRPAHRSQAERREAGRFLRAEPRLHRRHGSRLQRLRSIWPLDHG